jgi:hypothetical protein
MMSKATVHLSHKMMVHQVGALLEVAPGVARHANAIFLTYALRLVLTQLHINTILILQPNMGSDIC